MSHATSAPPRVMFRSLSILLHAFTASGMTTQAICESTRPMDAFRFRFQLLDQNIVQDLYGQLALFAGPVTILAGPGACRPKDQVAVRIDAQAA